MLSNNVHAREVKWNRMAKWGGLFLNICTTKTQGPLIENLVG